MSNSYRLRTKVGVDKRLNVSLEQDFEYLEILSLKLLQSQIYQRRCSDYGVIVGRVTANNGFGVPNVKVSVFTPLTDQDAANPIISELYPYKTISDLNEDGYRYNLLPYTQSHSGHVPVGTFFSREDVLINPNYIEVFDKYYKYTALTNESGDFMIFGVPVGDQLVHIDIDLSDIGEFSLSPQDLIRMGIATESQVAGNTFRKSTNLNELVQLLTFNRSVYVDPLWGEPEVCNLSINRLDFDLTAESNINITPTSIFMGSIFSSNDDQFQKRNCKPKITQGELCNLVAGPGQILAIRQTINLDDQGRPILETFDLEQGGQVIDDNGTWLVDLPMNLDYVTTNEFGERVFSNDPTIGIPTKAKYRFKIKWNQSPKLSEPIKRGYFLVPNVREYGWDSGGNTDPLKDLPTNNSLYKLALKSYAFSLDWNDYADIQAAINCEDSFYPFLYNKVYTISQLIDQYRNGYLPNRMISIRNILDQSCESTNIKFPTNDAIYRFDLIYLLFTILIFVFKPILYIFLWVAHMVAWVLKFLDQKEWRRIANLPLPNLSYPECDLCECKIGKTATGDGPSTAVSTTAQDLAENAIITPVTQYTAYDQTENYALLIQFAGQPIDIAQLNLDPTIRDWEYYNFLAPNNSMFDNRDMIGTLSLPIGERINLFNVKAKYFDSSSLNPGGGVNRIKVTFDPTLNTNTSDFHYDNTTTILVKPEYLSTLTPGTVISFQDPELSKDINVTSGHTTTNQFDNYSTTGTSINNGDRNNNNPATISVSFANPSGDGTNNNKTYRIYQNSTDAEYYKFPADIEYFQVVTAVTYSQYQSLICPKNLNPLTGGPCVFGSGSGSSQCAINPQYLVGNLNDRFINNWTRIYKWKRGDTCFTDRWDSKPWEEITDYQEQLVVIMVRGVDPYSSRMPMKYGLGRLFGYNNEDTISVTINGKLNIPIQASGGNPQSFNTTSSYNAVRHEGNILNDVTSTDVNNLKLYYNSYHFIPNTDPNTTFTYLNFNSDLPNYYSSLSRRSISSFPGTYNYLTGMFDTASNKNYGRIVDSITERDHINCAFSSLWCFVDYARNGFLVELGYRNNTACRRYTYRDGNDIYYNTPSSTYGFGTPQDPFKYQPKFRDCGYFRGEIIDGGSGMGKVINLYSNNLFLSLNGRYYNVSYWPGFVYAPTYLGQSFTYNNNVGNGKLVMRSDRLPTSTNTLVVGENSYPLQLNVSLQLYTISDDGTSEATGGVLVGSPSFSSGGQALEDNPSGLTVLNTFTCSSMVPLECYYAPNGEIAVYDPNGTPLNRCFTNQYDGQKIMENGCYVLITAPFDSIGRDIFLLTEWISRIQIMFGACRNVWSHIFTNNWINGTLYAFSFKNDRFFTSPFTTPSALANQPFSVYCKDTLVLHPTNNFYYRSSPYFSGNTLNNVGRFVGAKQPEPDPFIRSIFGLYQGNSRNLKFPTTIMDMGPRSQYIQELVYSDAYDGFIMNRFSETTYKDVSEILNLFIVSRLANTKFLERLFSVNGANIMTFFDKRSKNFVDGDYSQMLSISSEISVAELEAINYPPIDLRQDPIFFNNANAEDAVVGIFFSSDTQTRDYITPKRTIINPNLAIGEQCAFNYYDNFSQYVPLYQWRIKQNSDADSIFGSQENEWYTTRLNLTGLTPTQTQSVSTFFYHRYQSLDRLNSLSRYYRPGTSTSYSKDFKGYIYNVDYNNIGTPPVNPPIVSTSPFDFEYEPIWFSPPILPPNPPNQLPDRVFTVGAPFHFYFGLKKGKTAFDRFAKKWLDLENFTD